MSDSIPEGWRPEEGSTVIGPILALTTGWSDQQNQAYPILVIHDEITDKDISVHAFHYVLMDRLTKLQPEVGNRIGIKMGAQIPLKSNPNRTVQTYAVKIEGKSENIWDQIKNPRVAEPQQMTTDDLSSASTYSDDDIPL